MNPRRANTIAISTRIPIVPVSGRRDVSAGIAGLLFEDYIEGALRSPFVIGVMLIGVGLLIGWADGRGILARHLGGMTLRDAMLIGCAQA